MYKKTLKACAANLPFWLREQHKFTLCNIFNVTARPLHGAGFLFSDRKVLKNSIGPNPSCRQSFAFPRAVVFL